MSKHAARRLYLFFALSILLQAVDFGALPVTIPAATVTATLHVGERSQPAETPEPLLSDMQSDSISCQNSHGNDTLWRRSCLPHSTLTVVLACFWRKERLLGRQVGWRRSEHPFPSSSFSLLLPSFLLSLQHCEIPRSDHPVVHFEASNNKDG